MADLLDKAREAAKRRLEANAPGAASDVALVELAFAARGIFDQLDRLEKLLRDELSGIRGRL